MPIMFILRSFRSILLIENCTFRSRHSSTFKTAHFLRNSTPAFLGSGRHSGSKDILQTPVNHQSTHLPGMAEKNETAAKEQEDMGLPNKGWLPESVQLFEKLSKLTESGDWKRLPSYSQGRISKALFSRTPSVGRPGQILEYSFFANKKECKLVGVCQFGPMAEGPPGLAHGGAIATLIDASAGVLLHYAVEGIRVTANMNINYRSPTPLQTALLIEAEVEDVEGRKARLKSKIKSADGEMLHAEGSLLFIEIDASKYKK
ncbi:acyl-coenzyme A thioesterase THEM4-like [Glandiceps talaboti]